MRIIPVLDLLHGQVVHAVRGMRERYQPIQSVLCDSTEPVQVAKAFREQLGIEEIYIADLNAIQTGGQASHVKAITALAEAGFHILLDAGVSEVDTAQKWLSLGVGKVVIGAETLNTWEAMEELPTRLPIERLVFSLDMRAGKILSGCQELVAREPLAALEHLEACGWQEVILLDLERVGSETGIDQELISRVRAKFPGTSLILGGGVKGADDLLALKRLGVAGALMATALHQGKLNAEQVRLLR